MQITIYTHPRPIPAIVPTFGHPRVQPRPSYLCYMQHDSLAKDCPHCNTQVLRDVHQGTTLKVKSYGVHRRSASGVFAVKCAGVESLEGGDFDHPQPSSDYLAMARRNRTFNTLLQQNPMATIALKSHNLAFAHLHDSEGMETYVDNNPVHGHVSVAITNGSQLGAGLDELQDKCAAAARADAGPNSDDLRFTAAPQLKAFLNETRHSAP